MTWLHYTIQNPDADAEPQSKVIRDRRKAKKMACRILAQLINGYLANGNHGDWPEYHIDVLELAFKELEDELYRRGEP